MRFLFSSWISKAFVKKEIPDFLQEYEKLDDHKMLLLDELKMEIWSSQKKEYKARLKTGKKESKNKNMENLYIKQMKLF